MLFFLFFGGIVFLFLSEYSSIYSWSYVLPVKVRRSWIQYKHSDDYMNWDFYSKLLQNEFPYFKLLSKKEQDEFLVRLIDVKNYMEFEGREVVELDNRKLALLSASMVQLTFGFRDYRLYRFEKIIVYPGIFYSKFLDADVKGITYGTGFIYLSWSDFEDGYVRYRSKLNLGLHEFAHALMLQKSKYFDSDRFDTFTGMATILMKRAQDSGQPDPLFRDYGFTNHHEFWAVCVEVFFEQPLEFANTYPNLYKVTSRLLMQDPAELLNDYLVSESRVLNRMRNIT